MDRFNDDRTEAQQSTHTAVIGGRDSFMSGWGLAKNKLSYAFWACKPEDATKVTLWVNTRSDIKKVSRGCEISCDTYPDDMVHIYAVGDNHPALN